MAVALTPEEKPSESSASAHNISSDHRSRVRRYADAPEDAPLRLLISLLRSPTADDTARSSDWDQSAGVAD